jgi:hypothetical protein
MVLAAGMYKLENTPTPTLGEYQPMSYGRKNIKKWKRKIGKCEGKSRQDKRKVEIELNKKRMKIMQEGQINSQKGCIKSKIWRIPGKGGDMIFG